MIFASTPTTASVRHRRGRYLAAGAGWGRKHRPNPALLDFRQLHEGKCGQAMLNAAVAWHASMSTMVTVGAYGYHEGQHARLVLVRLAALCTDAVDRGLVSEPPRSVSSRG